MTKRKIIIIGIVICLVIAIGVLGKKMFFEEKEVIKEVQQEFVDVSDANNVDVIDKKLGNEIKITSGYLLSYAIKKSSIWYESKGYVKAVKCKDNECKITVTNDVKSGNNLILTIVQNKCNVKKGEYVNFVGTIDIETSSIELAKLSKDEIEYSNVIKIELDDLINNINLIRSNIFVINGYMVTDGDKYKLFDSKDSYLNNESAGNYFLINWKEKFNYTGNQAVTLQCNLLGSYKLNNCELKK